MLTYRLDAPDIERAVGLVQAGLASAVCTAPIHKKALKDGAGFGFPGHTEFLAHLAGVERVVMMLASPDLRVVPVTIHIALAEVPVALTAALLEDTPAETVGLCFDFGHHAYTGADAIAFMKRYADRIPYYHFKNVDVVFARVFGQDAVAKAAE